MEPDRYEESHTYFIAGILALVGGLVLSSISVFIFPYLILGWHYKVFDFIVWIKHTLHLEYYWPESLVNWSIELFFLLCSMICIFVAYISSNHIENNIYHPEDVFAKERAEARSKRSVVRESVFLIIKFMLLVLIIYAVSLFFYWAISAPIQP